MAFKTRSREVTRATVLALSLLIGMAASSFAQSAPPEALKQRDQELEALRAKQKEAQENDRKLRAEIDSLGEDRRKLNQGLIDAAARVRSAEERLAATESKLAPLQGEEAAIRQSLEGRRAVLAEVLAALQRIGRRPPPAVIVRPEDALQSVRTAMLLGAVLPEMREQADALAADLTELVRIRNGIVAEQTKLSRDLAAIAEEQTRMGLLGEERRKTQVNVEKTLDEERQRAAALGRQAGDLKDLIGKLEQNLDPATRAARAAARAAEEAKLQPESRTNLAVLKDPGRLGPAVAFSAARGSLPLPVNGVKIHDFGTPDGVGGTEKGLTIATRAGAQVTAPCDGWVVYSAPYRNYGQLLILNAGGGYHVLLAGMDRISVDLGQFVLTGEPVATMGGGSQMAATVASGSSQPILYVEFRKDGTPVDPGPWWAANEGEKVRG